jgi:hypothetical protein
LTPKIDTIDGLRALVVLDGGWQDEYADVIERERLEALSISVRGGDLTFLERLPGLRGLVLNAGDVRDLSPVQALRDLTTLTLNTPAKPRIAFDFNAFEQLETLRAYWNPGFASLFERGSLRTLWLFGPPGPDLTALAPLQRLERLELSQGRKLVSTAGVEALRALRFLGLYQQGGLKDLAGVDALDLHELALESVKGIDSLDVVRGLRHLRRLKVANCGEIASLAPLAGLSELEQFLAWESTRVVDGDLSVLLELPALRVIGMQERRGYRPSVREVEEQLSRRTG